ncbi:hypothetical protein J1605_001882 [Eschrichtius robustus]|uniref:Helicase ATP-binding domain-containing protein n=1 Tax=Eschrichtius robustus TaxID=9764 RepID=A0AB34HW55_ESCRO|nr:hypothetical protein J1605_001882 [Eschrichtius robustus]
MNPTVLCLNPAQPVTHYLVKWCSLPYEDSTWELRQDIDQAKIEEFEKLLSREPERERVGRVIKGSYKFHAIITTFEMILTDCPELRNIPWRCVVIDEAHRLKNRNCKLLEGLKLMDLEHKVLLTGTPLQNTVEELFSLLHFLEPGRFPSETTFMQEFGDLKTEEQKVQLLNGRVVPTWNCLNTAHEVVAVV